MPGGTEIQLHADGFTFAPYRMLVLIPFLPVPLQVLARDSCRWDAAREQLQDVIDLRLTALPVGRLVMTLQPEFDESASRMGF